MLSSQLFRNIAFKFLLIVCLVFILDFLVGKTLRYFYFNETSGIHFRTTYAMEKTEADLLVFGSSRANHHYVPEVFEEKFNCTFYNTGRDGSSIFYQYALLKAVLKRYKPKAIILDFICDFSKEDDSYDRLSALLPYYEDHEEIRSVINLKGPFEKIKLISKIYPYNSQLLTIAMGNLESNKKRKPDNKGYIPLANILKTRLSDSKPNVIEKIDSNKVNVFNQFLHLSKINGIKLIVVCSPIFERQLDTNAIRLCHSTCKSHNVEFLNFISDTTFINHSNLFHDVGHLNNNGAILFSKQVALNVSALN